MDKCARNKYGATISYSLQVKIIEYFSYTNFIGVSSLK